VDRNYKPRRANKAIELWEDGQPIYTVGWGQYETVEAAYAGGKRLAKTYGDAIGCNLEQGPLDFTIFAAFMRGLKDGGPTASGHATPAVYVVPPMWGLNEQYALANSWIIGNFLNLGAHGVQIVHARDPKAIEVYCHQAARYSFDYPNTPKVARLGLRAQPPGAAPRIWGLTTNQYVNVADVYPLNPRGEIMIGLKIEDKISDDNMAATLAVKGVTFAEWGHNDQIQSLFGLNYFTDDPGDAESTSTTGPAMIAGKNADQRAALTEVRRRVLAECKKNNVRFSNPSSLRPGYGNIIDQIKEGLMVTAGGEQVAIAGREFTKRKMPV